MKFAYVFTHRVPFQFSMLISLVQTAVSNLHSACRLRCKTVTATSIYPNATQSQQLTAPLNNALKNKHTVLESLPIVHTAVISLRRNATFLSLHSKRPEFDQHLRLYISNKKLCEYNGIPSPEQRRRATSQNTLYEYTK